MLSPDNKNSSTVKTKGSRSGMIEYRASEAIVRYYYRSRGSIDLILMTRAKSIPKYCRGQLFWVLLRRALSSSAVSY